MYDDEECIDLTVDFLGDDGTWRDGDPVTFLESPQGEIESVIVLSPISMIKWGYGVKNCLECGIAISPETMMIKTTSAWVLPCRECKYFSWYYDEVIP
tara:strand:- start:250 stop:543 length:294 start_codon:yes stop_codon:yes gene_type:complete